MVEARGSWSAAIAGVHFRFLPKSSAEQALLEHRYGAFHVKRPTEPAIQVELALEGSSLSVEADGAALVLDAAPGRLSLRSDSGADAEIALDNRSARLSGPLSAQPLDGLVRLLLSRALLEQDALLVHGSALAVDGTGFAFVGPSGSGKSTIVERYPGTVLSDEAIAVRLLEEGVEVAGTPFWKGRSLAVPLGGIAFVRVGRERSVEAWPGSRGAAELFAAAGPLPPDALEPALALAARVLERVPSLRGVLANLEDIETWLMPQLLRRASSGPKGEHRGG